MNTFFGIMIPFLGTSLGAGCVFFLKNELKPALQKTLLGFASGVMVAASIWSLLIPAMEMSAHLARFSFIPGAAGFLFGVFFLLLIDRLLFRLSPGKTSPKNENHPFRKNAMLALAVTLHNIPEGMAVGVVFAGMLLADAQISLADATALSVGIAIQNFPEGAIISLPLKNKRNSRTRAFFYGAASGAVEPVAAVLTILLASYIKPILPYLLSFAAGAMFYVVVMELIPEASGGRRSYMGALGFSLGFVLMMALDVALG